VSKKPKNDAPVEEPREEEAPAEPVVAAATIAGHPRARVSIRRTRTRAAVIAFLLVFALGLYGGQTPFDATWRALLAGVIVNFVAWRIALAVWRQIIIAELRAAEEAYEERKRERREEAEKRAERTSTAAADGFRPAA